MVGSPFSFFIVASRDILACICLKDALRGGEIVWFQNSEGGAASTMEMKSGRGQFWY
jgi:hypothetical protein